MEIIKKPLGLYKTNCYILIKENNVLIIDPGFHGRQIIDLIDEVKIPLAIILTHGHCDHICAVDTILEQYNIPVYMNKKDDELLHVERRMPSSYRGLFKAPYEDLKAGEYSIGPFEFTVYETPGHSKGSVVIAFLKDKIIFTGDTLFKGTVGKTATYNGSQKEIKCSIEFLKTLDPSYKVYPGHAENTTIEEEIKNNPYFK